MSAEKVRDLLQTYLPMPAIISLLGAIAIGVWTGTNTLNEIRNDAKENRSELLTAKREINEKLDAHAQTMDRQSGKLEVLQTTVTTLTVQTYQMQKQLDKMRD